MLLFKASLFSCKCICCCSNVTYGQRPVYKLRVPSLHDGHLKGRELDLISENDSEKLLKVYFTFPSLHLSGNET